jgi:hypothetical protein
VKVRTVLAIAAAAIATFTAIEATGDRPPGNRPPADHHDHHASEPHGHRHTR